MGNHGMIKGSLEGKHTVAVDKLYNTYIYMYIMGDLYIDIDKL